jgi:hypothetical protein
MVRRLFSPVHHIHHTCAHVLLLLLLLLLLQRLADSRVAADAALSAFIKMAVNLLPLLVRSTRSNSVLSLSWALPVSHQLAGVVAGGLPVAAVLLSPCSYYSIRDSLLAAVQGLLLVVMRKPLLFAAAAAAASSGSAAAQVVACHPALFHSCSAAVLLLVLQQRLSWAVWQVLWDVAACAMLVYADRSCHLAGNASSAAAQGLWQVPWAGWGQMLLPLAVLPLLYVCEHVDRCVQGSWTVALLLQTCWAVLLSCSVLLLWCGILNLQLLSEDDLIAELICVLDVPCQLETQHRAGTMLAKDLDFAWSTCIVDF